MWTHYNTIPFDPDHRPHFSIHATKSFLESADFSQRLEALFSTVTVLTKTHLVETNETIVFTVNEALTSTLSFIHFFYQYFYHGSLTEFNVYYLKRMNFLLCIQGFWERLPPSLHFLLYHSFDQAMLLGNLQFLIAEREENYHLILREALEATPSQNNVVKCLQNLFYGLLLKNVSFKKNQHFLF